MSVEMVEILEGDFGRRGQVLFISEWSPEGWQPMELG
jgi:hypothetical protein